MTRNEINYFVKLSVRNKTPFRTLYKVMTNGSVYNPTSSRMSLVEMVNINGVMCEKNTNVRIPLVYKKRKGVVLKVSDQEIWDTILENENLTIEQQKADFKELRSYFNKPIEDDEPRWCEPKDTTACQNIWIAYKEIPTDVVFD